MPTSRLPEPRVCPTLLILMLVWGVILPTPGAGQFPVARLNENTEIRSIRFRFLDSESFSRSQLKSRIGLTERGRGYGLKKALRFLPFISGPGAHPFEPLNLQMDVARIRSFYHTSGFPEAWIRYEVALDPDENVVDVEFLISEGRPRILAGVAYSHTSGALLEEILAPEVVPEWRGFEEGERALSGDQFGDIDRVQKEGNAIRWLRDRGYPFPTVESSLEVDSTGLRSRLELRIEPGSRSRIGSLDVEVEGPSFVEDAVVLREIPVQGGDWYSAGRVNEGRRRVSALDIFGAAVAEVFPMEDSDTTVQVLFRVRQTRPRNVSGFLGYTNVGGLTLGGQWEHRNFMGGARTLAVSGTAETGALAVLTGTPDKYFRGAVSLRQPFFFLSGLSLVASPFGEYRDDYRDRSWEAGMDGTLVYQYALLRAVSLRYRASYRKVLDYGLEDVPGGVSLPLGLESVVDSLTSSVRVSTVTLSATHGVLDDQANPQRGFVLQPSLEVTIPPGFPTNEYLKAELWGSLYRPLWGQVRIAGNLNVGRIFPFGASIPPADADGLLEFLQLRDINLTAGGPTDVRGWGSRLLGPKIPDTQVRMVEDSTTYFATRYLPLGGLAKITAAMEIQFPVPKLGPRFAGHVFLDGGRVWTPDERYLQGGDRYDQDRVYFSTGGGLGIETPVGPIRVSVGYKLNPSPLDLRNAADVQDLMTEDRSILEAPIQKWRRFQIHLTVGRVF